MTEPMLPLQIVLPGLVALSAAAWIVRVSVRANRTSFRGCALLALAGLSLAAADNGANGIIDGLFAAASISIVCVIGRVFSPELMRRETIVLSTTMFAVAGTSPAMLTAMLVLFTGSYAVMTAFCCLQRGKPLSRASVPMALPFMAAVVPLLLWRHFSAVFPNAPGAQAPRFGNALVDITGRGWLDLLSWGSA